MNQLVKRNQSPSCVRISVLYCLTLLAPGWAHSAFAQAQNNCSSSAVPPSPPAKTIVFPLADVRRGLCGVAYTVFEGVNPEPMQVEILGVLKNSRGPGQDMILARLHGPKPEYTGVVAGMSGSPVYVDGKLLGALSFRIGQFSKEPIAGITPMAEMLALRDGSSTSSGPGEDSAAMIAKPVATDHPEITPIETPLVMGGFSQEALDRFGERFRSLGLVPVLGLGSSDSAINQPEPLVPGSAVSAILVRGDLSMAGTCTVSYVDRTDLLACGHPITQFGHIAFPMTKATVLATLPSPLNAFKIITTTETVGEFTEDRNAAIVGRFNQVAPMIPVQVDITGPSPAHTGKAPQKTLRFEVVDNKDLTPSLMLVSIFQALQQNNLGSAEASYRLNGELKVAGQSPVHLEGMMVPNDQNAASINTALFVGERFTRIYGNTTARPVIDGLRLNLVYTGPTQSSSIERVRLSRQEVRPGDQIEVETTIRPMRAEPVTLRIPFTIPPGTAPGDLRLVVSDAVNADRLSQSPPTASQGQSLSLPDVIQQMNSAHRNDRIYVTLLSHSAQTVVEGATMGSVPLSMANVYESQKTEKRSQLTGETATEMGFVEANSAVTGLQVLTLKVK